MTTPRNSRRAEIKPVPSVEPDRTRCRAVVLSSGATQQCSRRPAATRQYRDGKLYPVCQQHKRAQWFEPWTARLLIGQRSQERRRDLDVLHCVPL